jgi:hypothetical protein
MPAEREHLCLRHGWSRKSGRGTRVTGASPSRRAAARADRGPPSLPLPLRSANSHLDIAACIQQT